MRGDTLKEMGNCKERFFIHLRKVGAANMLFNTSERRFEFS